MKWNVEGKQLKNIANLGVEPSFDALEAFLLSYTRRLTCFANQLVSTGFVMGQ